jgi:glycosyltransferase involved in cell wall biosynthesis
VHLVRVLGKLEPGGAQLAVLRLSRELERRHGVRTTLLVGDATPEGLDLARRHEVHTVAHRTRDRIHPVRNLQWTRSMRFADWLADRIVPADLVHAHMVGAWWAAAQVVGDVPLVASEHNEVTWSPRHLRTLRPAAARVDRFFAMGPSARAFALAAGVRPAVIGPARSPLAGLDAVARPGLASPRLTFAGRFCEDKGVDVLVEALGLLSTRQWTAYLLGDGPLRARVTEAVRARGLADRVVLTGWVDDPGTFIAGSAVHVVPSREEAWSQSAVLALGLGVPVVGTRVDGLVDTLSGGRGRIVPADDAPALAAALETVLDGRVAADPAVGLAYAQQFTAARVADFHLAAYVDVLAARTGEPAGAATLDTVTR